LAITGRREVGFDAVGFDAVGFDAVGPVNAVLGPPRQG